VLASLNHPNIAAIYGVEERALVMEYVDGIRIDEYCRARGLSVGDRLRLFLRVCEAVQFAHNNLVIHRDLKPANILVTADGQPRLVDFGIAALVTSDGESPGTARTVATMTPEYASPEQMRGERVTAVSDVYSLGMVLYELLSGAPILDLTGKRPDEVYQLVTEAEPLRPSVAASRRGDPALSRQLRGDLDAMVLMALRKEPHRRYPSVLRLVDDIEQYLTGRPVAARGEGPLYRSRKFVRRHGIVVGAAVAFVIALLAGIVATSWEARIARAERARAERRFNDVRKLANSVLFDYHDAIQALPGATAVRERLVRDAQTYLDSLAAEASGDPLLQRELAAA